jgi:hypothetical protein
VSRMHIWNTHSSVRFLIVSGSLSFCT